MFRGRKRKRCLQTDFMTPQNAFSDYFFCPKDCRFHISVFLFNLWISISSHIINVKRTVMISFYVKNIQAFECACPKMKHKYNDEIIKHIAKPQKKGRIVGRYTIIRSHTQRTRATGKTRAEKNNVIGHHFNQHLVTLGICMYVKALASSS